MGNTWTVSAWQTNESGTYGYGYVEIWRGESVVRALLAARKARRTSGSVKIEWR